MFQDITAPFPDDVVKLGCYVGPSKDVGPAMMANILSQNRQVFHRSTFCLLTPDDIAERDRPDTPEQLMARDHEKLVSQVLPESWRT